MSGNPKYCLITPCRNEAKYARRTLQSVTANTRNDGEEFLLRAAQIPVQVTTTPYAMDQANAALRDLAHGRVNGAAVLVNSGS